MNEDNCDGEDIEDDDEDDNTIQMKRQITTIKLNDAVVTNIKRIESIATLANNETQDAITASDDGERTKMKCTEEQRIKRQRKRKRRRRRRRRKRKSIAHQITFAVSKDASFNINAERVMPESSSDADESQRITSNSFASRKLNANMGLRVRRAILWIKVDTINGNGQYKKWTTARRLNHSANPKSQFTLWVFHIVEPYCKSRSHSRRVMCFWLKIQFHSL